MLIWLLTKSLWVRVNINFSIFFYLTRFGALVSVLIRENTLNRVLTVNMIIYLCILFLLLCFSCISIRCKQSISIFSIFFVALALFSAVRYDVGVDYMNYYRIYQDSYSLNSQIKEIGFAWFFHICYQWGISFEWVSMGLSLLIVFLAYRCVKYYSPNLLLSTLIFYSVGQFYFSTFNAVRQSVVIYAFYLLLPFIGQRKFWHWALGIVFLSLCFHATAVLLFPLYFLLNKKMSTKVQLLFLGITLCSTIFIMKLIALSPYAIYLKFEEFAAPVSLVTYILLFISAVLFIVGWKLKEKTEKELMLFNINLLLLAILFLSMLFKGTPLIMVTNRISYYFSPVLIFLLPVCIERLRLLSNRYIVTVLLSLFFSLLCTLALVINSTDNHLVPYQTIFSKHV